MKKIIVRKEKSIGTIETISQQERQELAIFPSMKSLILIKSSFLLGLLHAQCQIPSNFNINYNKEIFQNAFHSLTTISFFEFKEMDKHIEILTNQINNIINDFKKLKKDNSQLILKKDDKINLRTRIDIFIQLLNKNVEDINNIYYNISDSNKIPHVMKEDIYETINNYYNRSFKSSVIMSRRCLQKVLNEFNISNLTKNGRYKNIDEMLKEALNNKKIIDEDGFNSATKIRKFGGWGAHSQDIKKLDNITPKEAKDVLEELFTLIGEIYKDDNICNLTLI